MQPGQPAPELAVSQWFNTPSPLTLEALRGKVVLIHAFQMLCPGCVIHAIPQARKVHELYGDQGVAVVEEQHTEFLDLAFAHGELAVIEQGAPALDHGLVRNFVFQ